VKSMIFSLLLYLILAQMNPSRSMAQALPPPPGADRAGTSGPPSTLPGPGGPMIPGENQATVVPPEGEIPGDPSKDKFYYDETVGRDPFKMPAINTGKGAGNEPIINEDSLEGAPIPDGVKILAIIYDPNKPRALVQKLSNKATYVVFLKSRLGEGGGIVAEIREDEIVVVRSIETEGQTTVENIILRLNNDQDKKRTKN